MDKRPKQNQHSYRKKRREREVKNKEEILQSTKIKHM